MQPSNLESNKIPWHFGTAHIFGYVENYHLFSLTFNTFKFRPNAVSLLLFSVFFIRNEYTIAMFFHDCCTERHDIQIHIRP